LTGEQPDPLRWLAALGILGLLAVALIWLSVALGLVAKSVETAVRSLLANQHVGTAGIKAIVWCLAIAAVSYLWARYLYNRRPAH